MFYFNKSMYNLLVSKTSIYKINSAKGFTFVELILVSALMMLLLGLSVPFVTSLRSEVAMQGTLKQIKTDIVSAMGYSLAGKSIAALSSGDISNPNLIPSHYAIYFHKDDDYGAPTPYNYTECSTDIISNDTYLTKTIYSIKKDMPSESIFLKDIRLRVSEVDSGNSVDSAYIFFSAPLAKVNIISGYNALVSNLSYSFNSLDAFTNSDFKYIDLIFQFKDEENSITTLTFGIDKIINIT